MTTCTLLFVRVDNRMTTCEEEFEAKRMSNWHDTFTVNLHLVYIVNKSIITYACDISIYVQSHFCTM